MTLKRPFMISSLLIAFLVIGFFVREQKNPGSPANSSAQIEISPAEENSNEVINASASSSESELQPGMQNDGLIEEREALRKTVVNSIPTWVRFERPDEQYADNIDNALSGSGEAQFLVAQSLEACLKLPPSADDRELNANALSGSTGAVSVLQAECSLLRAKQGKLDFSETVAWYKAAAESGYPLAVLKVNALEEFSEAEREQLFVSALSTKNPEVFNVIATYHSFRQADGTTEFDAWNYFSCHFSPTCSEREFLDAILLGGFEHEIQMVVDRIEEIGVALREESWHDLVPET